MQESEITDTLYSVRTAADVEQKNTLPTLLLAAKMSLTYKIQTSDRRFDVKKKKGDRMH